MHEDLPPSKNETTVAATADAAPVSAPALDTTSIPAAFGTKTFWLDMGERVGKTFVQTLFVSLAATPLTALNPPLAVATAGVAALCSFLIALIAVPLPSTGNPVVDLVERAGKTFLGSLVASLSVATGLGHVGWMAALGIAVSTTVASLATTAASQWRTGSASLILPLLESPVAQQVAADVAGTLSSVTKKN